MRRKLLSQFRALFARAARSQAGRGPLEGNRHERVQRLQIGLIGIAAMILLVGLANIIMNSVQQSRAGAVPEAAPTVAVLPSEAPARDPLADAGVVPDLPGEGDATPPPAGPASAPAVQSTNGAVPAQP